MTKYVPEIGLLLTGLGITAIPGDSDELKVSSKFLKFMIQRLVHNSLFDPVFYRSNYGLDDALSDEQLRQRFIDEGYFRGETGSAGKFDASWYLKRYPDLAGLAELQGAKGLEQHYLLHGRKEGRAGSEEELSSELWLAAVVDAVSDRGSAQSGHLHINSAKVQPFSISAVPSTGYIGGVVIDDPNNPLRHQRGGRVADSFAEPANYDVHLDGEWIYGGYLYPHFGHFMAECIHRIIPARRLFGDKKWLFVGRTHDCIAFGKMEDQEEFIRQILTFLGIKPDRFLALHQNAIVEHLYVAEQGADLGSPPKGEYLKELCRYSDGRLDSHRMGKVYVSRSGLPPGGGILAEAYLEGLLQQQGVTIFKPENHPFDVQVQTYRSAELLIFPEGSACHGVEVLGADALEKTLLILRRTSHRSTFNNILKPRSTYFSIFDQIYEIGSVVINKETGDTLEYLSMSLVNVVAFVEYLKQEADIYLDGIDLQRYVQAVKYDWNNYIEYHRVKLTLAPADIVNAVSDRLNKILPYLSAEGYVIS